MKKFAAVLVLGLVLSMNAMAADDLVSAVKPVVKDAAKVTFHLGHDVFGIGKFFAKGFVKGFVHAAKDVKRVIKK